MTRSIRWLLLFTKMYRLFFLLLCKWLSYGAAVWMLLDVGGPKLLAGVCFLIIAHKLEEVQSTLTR